jgi:cytochrome c oxidase assembly protein subunit 11
MPWEFKPTQRFVKVVPGETALAFYTVKNTSKHAMTGVATYNVFPPKSGLYFNKIQCFCFEEQVAVLNLYSITPPPPPHTP